MANTLKKIQTITVGSGGAASIEFTSIPQTYTDLKIVLSVRDNQSGATGNDNAINFNGSATSFTGRRIYGNGASISNDTQAPYAGSSTSAGTTASVFSNTEIYIPNYTSANNKSFSIDSVVENNATTGYQVLYAGLWSNTAAITSVKIVRPSTYDFVQYSTATLYGISNANTTTGGSGKATGGNEVYTDGTYWYHVFKSDGTFTPSTAMNVDYLVLAGGGSGGSRIGGGGGAGGMRCTVTATGGGGSLESALAVTAQAYSITVGAGGAAVTSTPGINGNSGSNSVFSTITATGGGGGGAYVGGTANQGLTGGSAGGSSYQNTTAGTRTASPVQGNNGGAGATSVVAAGGGGGAGAAGGNAVATNTGGAGGAGAATSISGTSTTYAGGGGGSGSTAAGAGGSGGGGAGATLVANATAAGVNTGSGGGGARNEYDSANVVSGAGGSGIVIIRYAA